MSVAEQNGILLRAEPTRSDMANAKFASIRLSRTFLFGRDESRVIERSTWKYVQYVYDDTASPPRTGIRFNCTNCICLYCYYV